MQILWNSKVKFVSFSQLLGLALWSLFGSDSSPFTAPGLIVSLGEKKKEKRKKKKSILLILNQPSEFCWSSWLEQAEGGWASLFSLPVVLQGWGPGVDKLTSLQPSSSIHCQAPLSVCARLAPSIQQLCCPWCAPIRGNSHTTFSLFAVPGARHSQNLFRVVQPPTELSLYGYC